MTVKKAVIPAAGLGTRMFPATKSIPKPMLPIVDKPTIQYIADEAFDSGVEQLALVVGSNKEIIQNYFSGDDRLTFIEQDKLLGLGHAILCCENFAGGEPFAVLLGDDVIFSEEPCLRQLMRQFEITRQTVLGVQEVPDADIGKYGIAVTDFCDQPLAAALSLVEKPSKPVGSNLAVMGRYIFNPNIFEHLRNLSPADGGEIQLTDAIASLLLHENVHCYRFNGIRYDIGDKYGYLTAIVDFALRHETLQSQFESFLKNKFTN